MTIEMSLADMRDFVREHLDSDDEELPNSLLDRFIANGSQKLETYSRTWDFRAVEYEFTTVEDTRSYDLDTTSGLILPAPLQSITSVHGPLGPIQPADHRKMKLRFPANSDTASTPAWYTVWGRHLNLWPKPDEAEDYDVIGYRFGIDWIAANSAPDFPADLHELIAWWALNRAYVFLDDPELSAYYRDEFDRELKIRSRPYLSSNDAQPLIFNGGTLNSGDWPFGERARYDWE